MTVKKKRTQPNSGQFQKGHPAINHTKNKPLRDALVAIADLPAGNVLIPVTNADLMAIRLWDFALSCTPSNPKGLNAIVEVFDRIEGRTKPSEEELEQTKGQKSLTVVLPRQQSNTSTGNASVT